jgi:GNAT superfamily N-acetyltransferase
MSSTREHGAARTLVRAARPEDLDGLVPVHLAAFLAGNGPALSDEVRAELTPASFRERWGPVIREPPPRARVFVGLAGARLVGVAGAGPARDDDISPRVGELYALYVDPDEWGAGHGTALHDAALRHLVAEGFGEAILWVLEANSRARRFYAARGWSEDDSRGEFMGAPKLRLRRPLAR